MSEIETIIAQVGQSPLALATLALTLLAPRGDWVRARALCERALMLAPHDGEVRAIHAEVFSAGVGPWFFNMVRDEARHEAYDRAIRRAAVAGGRVLDIGTGTGLFAMMAARAGAKEVISCERNAAVAEAARATIARNGFQDIVRVVVKSSADLTIGADLPEPADILLWDNTGSDLIGLGTLPDIEDAIRRLVKPGAPVIPAGCTVCAALAEHTSIHRWRMGQVAGFDLSAFNALAEPVYPVNRGAATLAVRSSAAAVFGFDFRQGGPFPPERVAREVVGSGGMANGLVQWLEFTIDDLENYKGGPDILLSPFTLNFHPAIKAFEATARKVFRVGASHDRTRLRVWLES